MTETPDPFRFAEANWLPWMREHGPEAYARLAYDDLLKVALGEDIARRFPRSIEAAAGALADVSPLLSWPGEDGRLVVKNGPLIPAGTILTVTVMGGVCKLAAVPPLPVPVHKAFAHGMTVSDAGAAFVRDMPGWLEDDGDDLDHLTTAVLLQHLLTPRSDDEQEGAFWTGRACEPLAFATMALVEDDKAGPFGAFAFPLRVRTEPDSLPPEALLFAPRVIESPTD